ncbi:MAG: Amidophosphoribosyltransferase [Candidatus Scalindua arabica]|uniref:Amidophosphoribosyltransferase n=1 Tax=Candidatus Scalindua arabica TaxID=1127984 RepID=A0A942A4B6_9BACT|nr:Amidophosphoribosyltransferase [Candidatus Scalindua arabica]
MAEAKEYCGLFGIFDCDDAVEKVFYGLSSLQHRGEESAGIASSDGKSIKQHKNHGLVSDVFSPESLSRIKNPHAIGHVRYSTFGSSDNIDNVQPLVVLYSKGEIAIAHNGQLLDASKLRNDYEQHGSIFHTTSDTEVIVHLMAKPSHVEKPNFSHVLNHLKGAFALLFLTKDEMVGVRDRNGFRPLSIGKLNNSYVLSSETCAFDQIGAEFVRDVEPGEVVYINKDGLKSEIYCSPRRIRPAYCIFELIYFARPDSNVFGENVHLFRKQLGRKLAKEAPVDADIVIAVPEGGNSAAMGYSEASGIPLDRGFIRNHYVGRTFIQPEQGSRHKKVELKLNAIAEVVRGKRVVVVDDSVVRGTTSKSRLKLLRKAGAKEVHLRISCPPHRFPCHYGIDFQIKDELIAANHTLEEIKDFLHADSLGYLSAEGMLGCTASPRNHYCNACFTGNYPASIENVGKKTHIKEPKNRKAVPI